MRPKRNHWYVIGWTDAPCQVGLCINAGGNWGAAEFFVPAKNKLMEVDGYDQVVLELENTPPPSMPPLYHDLVLLEDTKGRIINPKK